MQTIIPLIRGDPLCRNITFTYSSRSRTLYTGVTNDLQRRMFEHKSKLAEGFTTKYNIDRLVYFESTEDVTAAISREKQIKGGRRSKKVAVIESTNPAWQDLSASWFEEDGKKQIPRSRSG